jgi:hypothetical protein
MLRRNLVLIAAILLAAGSWIWATSASADPDTAGPLVYELRTYTAAEGKMEALHARFRNHTLKLFEKHGIKNIVYWTPTDKENTLVYVVAHSSQEAAKKAWAAFIADPEWQAVYKESQKDGSLTAKIESVFLKPTDYSPMK